MPPRRFRLFWYLWSRENRLLRMDCVLASMLQGPADQFEPGVGAVIHGVPAEGPRSPALGQESSSVELANVLTERRFALSRCALQDQREGLGWKKAEEKGGSVERRAL